MARLGKIILLMWLLCFTVLVSVANATKYTITFRDIYGANDTMVCDITDYLSLTFGTYGTFDAQVYHGFFAVGEAYYSTIDFPNAVSSCVYGANDSTQFVGEYKNILGPSHGYLGQISSTQDYTTLDVPGAQGGTYARGINADGLVVGYYDYQPLGLPRIRSFIYNSKQGYSTFAVPDILETRAWGINGRGQVVGYFYDGSNHGFLYSKEQFTYLNYPGADNTFARGINNIGKIVGSYEIHGSSHGFVFVEGKYESFDIPGANQTWVMGINEAGKVVGTCLINNHRRGFVATPRVPITSLMQLFSN